MESIWQARTSKRMAWGQESGGYLVLAFYSLGNLKYTWRTIIFAFLIFQGRYRVHNTNVCVCMCTHAHMYVTYHRHNQGTKGSSAYLQCRRLEGPITYSPGTRATAAVLISINERTVFHNSPRVPQLVKWQWWTCTHICPSPKNIPSLQVGMEKWNRMTDVTQKQIGHCHYH